MLIFTTYVILPTCLLKESSKPITKKTGLQLLFCIDMLQKSCSTIACMLFVKHDYLFNNWRHTDPSVPSSSISSVLCINNWKQIMTFFNSRKNMNFSVFPKCDINFENVLLAFEYNLKLWLCKHLNIPVQNKFNQYKM